MANLTIAEPRPPCLPEGTQVNGQVLAQQYFESRKYTCLHREEDHAIYARLLGDNHEGGSTYYICDILVVAYLSAEEAENAVPRLDAIADQLRKGLLRGKSLHPEIQVRQHGFLRLHRPYVRYSFTYHDKPVGFQIRPLILVPERGVWEYYMGLTVRVDTVSFVGKTLNFYLKDHLDALKTARNQLLNFQKFHYPRIAQSVIGYGHYPLIILWLLNFFLAIFQLPFPIPLEGLIILTIGGYGGCVGAAYFLHQLFARAQGAELQEPTPFQSTRSSPISAESPEIAVPVPQEVYPRLALTEAVVLEVEAEDRQPTIPSQEVTIPKLVQPAPALAPKAGVNRSQFHGLIRKILVTTELEDLNASGMQLLANTFYHILATHQRESPRDATLLDLLKAARNDPYIDTNYKVLAFWVNKLITQTPFEAQEVNGFRKVLLRLLQYLQLLPHDLTQVVQDHARPAPSAPPPPPVPTPTLKQPVAPERTAPAPKADSPLKPEVEVPVEPPDLEVDSQVLIQLPELHGQLLRKIREHPKNGVFCTIIVDSQVKNFAELVQQFEASTKDLDVSQYYSNINTLDDPFLEKELADATLPLIMVGCGEHKQFLPFSEQQGDYARLRSAIRSYLCEDEGAEERPSHPSAVVPPIKPLPTPSIRPLPLKGANGEGDLITLKERRPPDNNTLAAVDHKGSTIRDPQDRHEKEPEKLPPKSEQPDLEKELSVPAAIPERPLPKSELVTPPTRETEAPSALESKPVAPPIPAPPEEQPVLESKPVIPRKKEASAPAPIPPAAPVTPEKLSTTSQEVKRRTALITVSARPVETPTNTLSPDSIPEAVPTETSASRPPWITPLLFKNLKEYLILIDESNLAFLLSDARKDDSGPRLECVFQVIEMLAGLGFTREKMLICFDASIKAKFGKAEREDDYKQLKAYIQTQQFPKCRITSAGEQADTALVSFGATAQTPFLILTNDGLEDQPDWMYMHRITVTLDHNDAPQIVIESGQALLDRFQGHRVLRRKERKERKEKER